MEWLVDVLFQNYCNFMSDLKKKAINASKWATIDNLMNLGGAFLISLILARLLKPSDYGLIGMTSFFTTFFNVFIRSGFTLSLVRFEDTDQRDYSTIFFFNIVVCIISYVILFFLSPFIASFFHIVELSLVIRILGISLILEGLSVVQTALRIKEINYKIQAQISIFGTLLGGGAAIYLAYNGFGVWSLVVQVLLRSGLNTMLYWMTSKWRPNLIFSVTHLKKHLTYSLALLRNDITIVIFDNLYNLVIGRFYSAFLLGQYTRAKNFLDITSMSLTRILSNGVSFPILCKLQDNQEDLKQKFFHFLRLIVYISSFTTFLFVAVSDALLPLLIGSQWNIAIFYIKLLALAAFLYPINVYNISIARVLGKTNIFANAILFQRIMIVPCVIIGIYTSVEVMIVGSSVAAIFSWIYNSIKVRNMLGIDILKQIRIQATVVRLPFLISLITYFSGLLLSFVWSNIVVLFVQLLVALLLIVSLSELFKCVEFLELKSILFIELKKINTKK